MKKRIELCRTVTRDLVSMYLLTGCGPDGHKYEWKFESRPTDTDICMFLLQTGCKFCSLTERYELEESNGKKTSYT